ncbi:low affinity Fe/Cu permease [Kribbella aluminosa]|uniref:Low affinity Fe/Cu permease n=1 Tax=Kribbella aluminosa TaxID=416017 RepID=A0ABS4UKA5_9ACTN|nr:low affinity iron permease family protein [Kribbella aluminosa]MBP2352050.1 low affinity Fe/Cu permease [Kribbella aluminosa]
MTDTVAKADENAHMPSDVSGRPGFFDRFATAASNFASRAWFFGLCVLLVVVWAPSYFVIGTLDTWQLIINTATTIVTFLLVALLQNSQRRSDESVQDKLNAVAAAMAALMEQQAENSPDLRDASRELRDAVGLEDREKSS